MFLLRSVLRRSLAKEAHLAGEHKSAIVKNLWAKRAAAELENNAEPNSDGVTTVGQSRQSIDYDFANDALLRDQYTNPWV
jgi:hypothetical protein